MNFQKGRAKKPRQAHSCLINLLHRPKKKPKIEKKETPKETDAKHSAAYVVENLPVSIAGARPGDVLVAFRLKFYIGMVIEVLQGEFFPIIQRYNEVKKDKEEFRKLLLKLQSSVPKFHNNSRLWLKWSSNALLTE